MTVDFNDYFWGEKNNGFDVLYHNMKYGLVASKDLSEFLRERVNVEENNSKLMTKLAHKATTGCAHGTFAPIWSMLKTSTERLSGLHADLAKKIGELAKDITKYAEDLHKKHKSVKEEETTTLDVVQAMQSSTAAVQKAKDTYTNRVQELEKLKRETGSPKDLEKVEAKLKKQQEDYKALVEKHNPIKTEFEKKMTVTCKRFQDIEESHLRQMREFLVTYVELIQTNEDMVGQVHQDFKRQFLDMTVDKLLEQFVLNKYTGLEKPELIELDLVNFAELAGENTLNTINTTNNTASTSSPSLSANQQYGRVDLSSSQVVEGAAGGAVVPQKRELNIRSWFSSSSMASSQPVATNAAHTDLVNLDGANGSGRDQPQRSMSPGGGAAGTSPAVPISGFLRSRREKAKSKKEIKKKKSNSESNSVKEDVKSDTEDKDDSSKIDSLVNVSSITKSPSSGVVVAAATPEIDEDGYSIQPKGGNSTWDSGGGGSGPTNSEKGFYSSSDSDSEDEQRDKKIHVEIKPLTNGAPISASVDELRATVETLSLSTLGGSITNNNGPNTQGGLGGLQSPIASNVSTPVTTHPYAPLQSPTFSMSNNSVSRYADLGDIFSEVAEINKNSRQIPTPTSATSNSSIAIPRPPSRRSEAAGRGRISPMSISRADSVGSLEFRTASIVGMGSSRGPSPLTIGMSDTIPIAVAFHEIIHAFFRGADESRCQVKINGDMMLSFPAGIVGVLANNPTPPKLGFRIKADQNLDTVLPNRQLVQVDKTQSTAAETVIEVSMAQLTSLLRRQSEQNPGASYFNVDILKYQVRVKPGAASTPFQLVSYWKCEPRHTDLKIDYKYNAHAMSGQSPLLNVSITVPVDGGVKNVQSKPHSAWLGESNRLVWNFTDISQYSDNNGVGTLRARLEVANGPSTPAILNAQFNCEGKTLSGVDFQLTGTGYRVSLVKRRFVSGKYICEADGVSSSTPTLPTASSPAAASTTSTNN